MKITFKVPELQKRLSQLSSVIKQKAPEPIYGKVRVFSESGVVFVQGIDIDTTLTLKLPSATSDGVANILLDFEEFNGLVQLITVEAATLNYTTEQAAVLKFAKWSGKFTGTPTDKFIELPVVQGINEKPALGGNAVGLPGLKEQIEQVEYAVPKPDGKFVIPSAKLESTNENLTLVATDGVRLAISTVPANYGVFETTLPKAAMDFLKKLDGGPTVTISETEGAYYFQTEIELLTYSKTYAEFPPYRRIIPATGSFPTTITLANKNEFQTSLKTLTRMTNKEKGGIRFEVSANGTTIEAKAVFEEKAATGDIYTDMADDTLDAVVVGAASKFKLNPELIAAFFEKATFPVTIHVKDDHSVLDMHANGGTQEKPVYRFLVMPMRLQ